MLTFTFMALRMFFLLNKNLIYLLLGLSSVMLSQEYAKESHRRMVNWVHYHISAPLHQNTSTLYCIRRHTFQQVIKTSKLPPMNWLCWDWPIFQIRCNFCHIWHSPVIKQYWLAMFVCRLTNHSDSGTNIFLLWKPYLQNENWNWVSIFFPG